MDIEYLLRELESLAYKVHVPGFVDLIETVRTINEKTTEVIAPHEPISDASRTLTALHTELDSLCSQLEISLPAFKTTYTGAGSDVYHTSATFSLQGMQQQRDALAYAAQQHQTLSDQLALAREMQIALIIMLGIVIVTLTALVASAGVDAPITVPAAIAETVGAAGIIATLTEALAGASIAMNALLAFLATEEGLGLLAATGITLVELTHPTLLTHPITATPGSTGNTGVIVHEINLTKYPELDPQQQAAADDLFREFNGTVRESWIEYLMHVLGLKNVSPEVAKQVIRCLRTKGYLDISERMKSEGVDPASPDNAGLMGEFKKAWNAIMDQLNPRTLQGAWAERNNIDTTIPALGPKDHIAKTENGITAVETCIKSLDKKIADYRTPPRLRAFYQTVKKALENTRDVANRLRKGNRSQGPSTWEDPKGEVPFGKDLIEASGCLPA